MTDLEWLTRISAADVTATAATRTVVDTGGFKLLLSPNDSFGGVNWATPLKANPSDLEINAMTDAFRAHNRTPRLEFIAECWGEVAGGLTWAGFRSEGEAQEIMLVTGECFKPVGSGDVTVGFLEADSDEALFRTYFETQTAGFGYGAPPRPLRGSGIGASRCAGVAVRHWRC